MKDYYKILELSPNATTREVRKNFRKLALRYHPDTNQGNRYAEAWYREIQEAYETLTNIDSRDAYLQQRWLLKSQGRAFTETIPLTPTFILKQANELLEQVKDMDHFRMSHKLLQQQILLVLDDEKIDALLSYNEADINREFGEIIIASMFPLEYPLMKPLIKQLYKLSNNDDSMLRQIKTYNEKRKQEFIWEKYQGLIILLITILLCAIIYFAASKK